ncbi:hypothetical protein RIF29_39722 [Crotalaria pallida]|uniref:GRF-type domain-containing protein n=1 Tax=Crotalaria pallida TaxID=3830 RepID=A0AAN9HTL1_CROPI
MASSQQYSDNVGDCKRKSKRESSSTMDSASSSMKKGQVFMHGGYEGIPPYCSCGGARAVLRTARTEEHYGLRFWGCRFYKENVLYFFVEKDVVFIQGSYLIFLRILQRDIPDSGCNFFEWYKDDIVREKDLIIMKQKLEIEVMQKDLAWSRKWMKILVVLCIGMFLCCPWSFELSCDNAGAASLLGTCGMLGAGMTDVWVDGPRVDGPGSFFLVFLVFLLCFDDDATEVWEAGVWVGPGAGVWVGLAEVWFGAEVGPGPPKLEDKLPLQLST